MGKIGTFELVVILVVVLVFFGGRRIPEIMRGLGEGIRSFKDGIAGGSQPAQQSPTTPAPPQAEEKK